MSKKREVYKKRFPRTLEFNQRPPIFRKLIDGTPAPVYSAGLVLYSTFIFEKYNNPRTWNSLLPFQDYLIQRSEQLGYENLTKQGFHLPFQLRYGINGGILLSFASNHSNQQMDDFLINKDNIIDIMCQLLDLESESEQAKIRAKFKWYRGAIFDDEDDDDCD